MRGELDARDNQLSGVTSELEKLREDQHLLKGEVEDRGSAIVTLQTELEAVRGEVVEKEQAIATLKAELEAVRGDIQLNLFPTPSPEPTPTPSPELNPEPFNSNLVVKVESPVVNSEPLIVTPTEVVQTEIPLLDSIEGTVSVGGLMEHLRDMKKENPAFPDPPEKTQTFTDAASGKTRRLKELEKLYGFNLLGYIPKRKAKEYRYIINH